MHLLHRISWYHTMIDMPAWRFMLIILSFYVGINLFCQLYYGIGIEHLDGITGSDGEWVKFGQAYFFSAQTFTVGYGHISPTVFDQFTLSPAEALSVY
jgi:inward rectifier potassium channel